MGISRLVTSFQENATCRCTSVGHSARACAVTQSCDDALTGVRQSTLPSHVVESVIQRLATSGPDDCFETRSCIKVVVMYTDSRGRGERRDCWRNTTFGKPRDFEPFLADCA
ncbi:hypothetical protein EVAR_90213_1 [Eumeta japonica]|uniref:Uncharacterized protein n=1 Tax=Eumeta variegata TaxID=151549 RepID=A0A4C1WV38_EUMVA|nr:hypothetical protein EVAR_90213_1 [Eumeta japonica]